MLAILIIYALCGLLTSTLAGYQIGKEQGRVKIINPTTFQQVNFTNSFFMLTLWPVQWAAFLGRYAVRHETKHQATYGLGIPPEAVKQ